MFQSCHSVLGKVDFDHQQPMCRCVVMQKKPTVSCPFLWAFPSPCVPEATEDIDIHSFVYSALTTA
jgi:hypothetical protein